MSSSDIQSSFGFKKIMLPVAVGFGISAYLLWSGFNPAALAAIPFSSHLVAGLALAALTVVIRDLAYMWRIKAITGHQLSWYKSFEVIMLWEFGSAITPGAVGGIALALFILKKEHISYGRSTATIMLTTFLDNLSFVLVFAAMYLLMGSRMFMVPVDCPDVAGNAILQGISSLADKSVVGWGLYAGSAAFFALSLFVFPRQAKELFCRIGQWTWLQRWSHALKHLGEEIEVTANEFKKMPASFFAGLLSATLVAWVSRYLLANALLFAFSEVNLNHLEVLARQYVLWVFIVIPSTPGAAGLAEFSFVAMNCAFIPSGLAATVAILWRMYSYYFYLLVGALVFPKWLVRVNKD
ncbi:MAG: flippase-like domain-containing protein [Bacteroidetes bacterium]|nr:flippase-like domain-containing protein [Bacteroidota bacterium]